MLASDGQDSFVYAVECAARFDCLLYVFYQVVERGEGFEEFVFQVCAFECVDDCLFVKGFAAFFQAAGQWSGAFVRFVALFFFRADAAYRAYFAAASAVSLCCDNAASALSLTVASKSRLYLRPFWT